MIGEGNDYILSSKWTMKVTSFCPVLDHKFYTVVGNKQVGLGLKKLVQENTNLL